MKKFNLLYLYIFLTLVFFWNCATTGPGGKKDLILISESDEISLGSQFAAEVEKEQKVYPDTVLNNYVNEVGQKLVRVSERSNLKFHFKVIESEDVNAFALPGGYIYVYTGLLKVMDNEAELAAVLGHETGHVVARHGVKKLQKVVSVSLLLDIAFGKTGKETAKQVSTLGISLALQGYSRNNELESDFDGVIYLDRAGYNPYGMVTLLQKLHKLDKSGRNFFEKLTASHPEPEERVKKAQAHIASLKINPENKPVYEERYKQMKERLQKK